jgi:hypothetical protein
VILTLCFNKAIFVKSKVNLSLSNKLKYINKQNLLALHDKITENFCLIDEFCNEFENIGSTGADR